MKVTPAALEGVLIIEPDCFADERGFFLETFNTARYTQAGLDETFRQDNHSRSRRGVIRGLHYQLTYPQGKLLYVVRGEIFDVAVDIRRGSATFGKWTGLHLSETNKKQFFIPGGFAHGFSVLSDTADVVYKCTEIYRPGEEGGIAYNDPDLGIPWEVEAPLVSDKDAALPRLKDAAPERLPKYTGPVKNNAPRL